MGSIHSNLLALQNNQLGETPCRGVCADTATVITPGMGLCNNQVSAFEAHNLQRCINNAKICELLNGGSTYWVSYCPASEGVADCPSQTNCIVSRVECSKYA